MKDAYSFHADISSLEETYRKMHRHLCRIFTRMGLRFRAVTADTGAIGGSGSHEFHVLADSGEDAIVFCPGSDYAANIEMAESLQGRYIAWGSQWRNAESRDGRHRKPVKRLRLFLSFPVEDTVKTLAVIANGRMYLLLLRGDHHLNETKIRKIPFLSDFRLATEAGDSRGNSLCSWIYRTCRFKLPVIADPTVMEMSNFVCGANEEIITLLTLISVVI